MAYIPRHKRHQHTRDADRSTPVPSPIPASLIPRFNRALNLGSGSRRRDRHGDGKIVYAAGSISRWWPVGAASNGDPIPASFRLEPFDCEIVERRGGEKPLVLVSGGSGGSGGDAAGGRDPPPWVSIAERIEPDLVAAALGARGELECGGGETVKLSFVARFGKIFFHGGSSVSSLDSIRRAAAAPSNSRNQLYKSFYTNVPNAYMENIKGLVAQRMGFKFDSDKELYHVKISDKSIPDSTITCKCIVDESGQLEIYKVELNLVRHFVADISCLYKDLDLRLLMVTKWIMKTFGNEENDAMRKLVRSAVIDPDVKGGLRWPLGKEPAAERFRVVGVWHTKYVAFKSNSMRLKLRSADRFDHMNSTGEVSTEVSLKLTEITKLLKDIDTESAPLKEMVQEAVKLFWDHFLICDSLA